MVKAIKDKVVVVEVKEKQHVLAVNDFKPRLFRAEVMSVGSDVREVKEGMVVLVDRAGLEEFDQYAITPERNVFAVLSEDNSQLSLFDGGE